MLFDMVHILFCTFWYISRWEMVLSRQRFQQWLSIPLNFPRLPAFLLLFYTLSSWGTMDMSLLSISRFLVLWKRSWSTSAKLILSPMTTASPVWGNLPEWWVLSPSRSKALVYIIPSNRSITAATSPTTATTILIIDQWEIFWLLCLSWSAALYQWSQA